MIKKAAKLSVLALCGGLVVGCAGTAKNADDIANLQAQVEGVKVQVTAAEASAAAAAASASAAEAAANETSSKLDRMFKKSMSK